jgi:hypothetical protein
MLLATIAYSMRSCQAGGYLAILPVSASMYTAAAVVCLWELECWCQQPSITHICVFGRVEEGRQPPEGFEKHVKSEGVEAGREFDLLGVLTPPFSLSMALNSFLNLEVSFDMAAEGDNGGRGNVSCLMAGAAVAIAMLLTFITLMQLFLAVLYIMFVPNWVEAYKSTVVSKMQPLLYYLMAIAVLVLICELMSSRRKRNN